LKPGDRVRFAAQAPDVSERGENDHGERRQGERPPEAAPLTDPHLPAARAKDLWHGPGEAVIEILNPGFELTVQRMSRPGFAHLGISAGGAADSLALRIGNRLVGNHEAAGAFEMAGTGARFRFLRDTWIAVTGAANAPTLDSQPLVMWTSFPVKEGQTLSFGVMEAGMRAYLCVNGGLAESGGIPLSPRMPVFAGGAGVNPPSYKRCPMSIRDLYARDSHLLRVTKGPQWDWFTPASQNEFFAAEFQVNQEVSRRGLRIQGPVMDPLPQFAGQELTSEGVANGTVQIPAGGQPLILFCEQHTTGGYPKMATVIRSDLWRLGQIRPGTRVKFEIAEIDEAWRLNREFELVIQNAALAI
jgi:allophanate hydrolase subunit 2